MERVRSARDGGSIARKISPSPAKRSSDFSFHQKEFRSSIELAKKFKQIKQEKIDKLHERLQGNTKQKVQEVVEVVEDDSPLKIGTTKKRTLGKLQVIGWMRDFIQLQHSKEKAATKSLEGEKTHNSCHLSSKQPLKVNQNQTTSGRNRDEDLSQPEDMECFAQGERDINQEEEVTNTNKEVEEGISKKRTRGMTLCKMIHARTKEEREEVTFNDGQPIGPTNKAVSNLSLFLGTLARKAIFCPLIYTSWKEMPDQNIEGLWRYTNRKLILPKEARDWVETTVRDSWRRYKHQVKKDNFLKYSNMTERLKHRPPNIPESHFRKLCEYWSLETIQSISERNTRSRAQQKWRHRMGPTNFVIIREKLRAKEQREPTQAEIFIETRKGNKGKQLDAETENTITQHQGLIEDEESNVEAFQVVLGKEHPGMVRCYGRNVTKTSLKQKEKINALKQAHNEEVTSLNEKVQTMEDTVGRLKYAMKDLFQHCRPGDSMESLENLLGLSPGDANSAQKVTGQPHMYSSTSTHVPNFRKNDLNGQDANDEEIQDFMEEFQDDDAFGF